MKIYKLIQIETPRLIIRPVQLGDELPLNEAIHNSLDILQKWQPWAHDPSMDATRGFVQKAVFAWASCFVENFPMVVINKQDQKIIGASGYNHRSNLKEGVYEIGYWCDIAYQGKGYVTEYANALVRYAFDALQATKVIILMQVENKKSSAVAQRLGFYNEGIKDRDPLDCVGEGSAQNTIYSKNSINNLPPLEVSWVHRSDKDIDSKIIAWAKETLKIDDNQSITNSKILIKTPWSSVMALDTGNESVYLKHTPKLIGMEAQIIEVLKEKFHAPVPTVIAYNSELSCFLMKDAGRSLRSILKKSFKTELFCKAILQFTSFQISLTGQVDVFINMGVPDWRLNKLPDLFKQAILEKDILLKDGLLESDINQLETLVPKIVNLCEKLSTYAIKQTIVQPDFNDNNTLIDDTGTITIIDLGEIAISHPFFSLINCLHVIKKHYSLTETDDAYLQIKEACLQNYIKIKSEKNVLSAFEIAHRLWHVYGLLAYKRLIKACDKEALNTHQHGKLSKMLKELINGMKAC